jgi:hypothetical protein
MSEFSSVKPWWKQLWPWLLISGPALAMLGCAITIWLAIHAYADQPIHEGMKRQGLKVDQVSK